jgi:3-oxoadipate enol-lactonase
MHVHDLGSGPAVLLLHGCPMPPEHLLPLATALAARSRVLVPELPGYGRTPRASGDLLAAGSAAIEAALRSLGVEEVVAVGVSLGAYRAISLAVRGEVRVRGIVSLGGFATLDGEDRASKRQLAAALRAGADLREAVPDLMLAPATIAARPDLVADVKGWLAATSAENLAAEQDAVAACEDLRPALRALSIPVLARVGTLDAAIPPRYSEEIARLANGSLELVDGVSHAVLHEDLEGTVRSIEAFLTRTGA